MFGRDVRSSNVDNIKVKVLIKMVAYEVSALLVQTLLFACNHYVQHIPKRWHLIADFVKERSAGNGSVFVTIGKSNRGLVKLSHDQINHKTCRELFHVLQKEEALLFSDVAEFAKTVWFAANGNAHIQLLLRVLLKNV